MAATSSTSRTENIGAIIGIAMRNATIATGVTMHSGGIGIIITAAGRIVIGAIHISTIAHMAISAGQALVFSSAFE